MTRGESLLATDIRQFDKHRDKFTAWLLANGSAILAPTNQHEVMRFMAMGETAIIYRNDRNEISSWRNGADVAFKAFRRGEPWRAIEKTPRYARKSLQRFKTLTLRDGENCVYCGEGLTFMVATIEHVVPLTAGGPDHLSNQALACYRCNRDVGHMSVAEKIRYAISKRIAR